MDNSRTETLLAGVLSILLAPPAASQWRMPPAPATSSTTQIIPSLPPPPSRPSPGLPDARPALRYVIAGGVIAGALGAVASTAYGGDFDFRYPAAGAALAIPVGVHLADCRRGDRLLGGLASAAIGAVFIAGGGDRPHVRLVSAPVAPAASVAVERLTGR